MHLTSLSLFYFRNYTKIRLEPLSSGLVVLTGPNGAGKTNLMEAISILPPGRGLRSADTYDLHYRSPIPENHVKIPDEREAPPPFALHAKIVGPYGDSQMGISVDPQTQKRIVHINGAPSSRSEDRQSLIRCAWLTPAYDRLFMDSSSARRRLIDRWVSTYDPAHTGRLTRMERLITERNRVLGMPRPDPTWLSAIESDLASAAVAVATARTDYVDRLRSNLEQNQDTPFPMPRMSMTGDIEQKIGNIPSVAIEQEYAVLLQNNREKDKAAEATTTGPHRSDLFVHYAAKNMPADQCSTGEQKALVTSLFLAHARVLTSDYRDPPILLLDDMMAHLDGSRQTALIDILEQLGGQIFISGTEISPELKGRKMTTFAIQNAHVIKEE